MELFPISSGGGQFAFVPLSLWYKFATRGCRWICYLNCQSNPSKAQNIFETLFALALGWRMQIMFQICFRLFLGGEILAHRLHVGVVFFIQSSFKFVRYLLLTSTSNTIFMT